MSLYELRLYVARPGTFDVMLDRWATYHHAIYPDYHTVLGSFVAHVDSDADHRAGTDAESTYEPIGFAMLLEHEDRADVDRRMQALVASDRMNQVPGPLGTSYVDHWERTFLHPLDVSTLTPPGRPAEARLHELRTFVAAGEQWDELAASYDSPMGLATVDDAEALASFVSQPERHEPDGVALLLRHSDSSVLADATDPPARAVTSARPEAARPDLVARCSRMYLTPTSFSNMA